jgi:hypothetical protein
VTFELREVQGRRRLRPGARDRAGHRQPARRDRRGRRAPGAGGAVRGGPAARRVSGRGGQSETARARGVLPKTSLLIR